MIEIKGLTFEVAERRFHGLTGLLEECHLPQCDERGILPGPSYVFDAGTDFIASFREDLESRSFIIDPFLRLCTDVGFGNGRGDSSPRLISVRLVLGQESEIGGIFKDQIGFQFGAEIFSVQFLFRDIDGEVRIEKHCTLFGSIEVENDAQIPLHILPEIAHKWLHQVAQVGFPD